MIPVKPNDVTWTDDQWQAIWAKDQDILVAAAAGSGKTAVLVERMIQKVLNEDSPVNIDELLVVTFTNASAAEMKHRVGQALERSLQEFPDSTHLRKQMSLINKASISTLHSFCLDVIRTYYYLIDIDPGFRIADTTEAELLKDEVLEEMLEEKYGEENAPFTRLVEAVTNDRSDDALHQLIRKLYEFSRSHANPDQWLDQIIQLHNVPEDYDINEHPLIDYLLFHIQLEIEGAMQLTRFSLDASRQPGGPSPRAVNFEDDLAQLERLKNAADWLEIDQQIKGMNFTRLKSCKGDEFNEGLIEQTKKWRDQTKKMIEAIRDTFFIRDPQSYLRDMRKMTDQLTVLISLVKEFHLRFSEAKEERGLVDFADLEHYCLAILKDENSEDGASPNPSEAARHYQRKFKEVLVDEYQDTNMVQETILQLVKNGSEKNGNLFMVGDVKQSIYRFRLAEPNLFLKKYRTFSKELSGLKIDLSQNFRSRPEILDATNFVFRQIMGEQVGEIDYNKDAELVKGAPYPLEDDIPVQLSLIDQAEPGGEPDSLDEVMDQREMEKSRLEARFIIKEIRKMIDNEMPVYDIKRKIHRPVEYRDIVILSRSMTWTPDMMEEFRQAGIPLYANVSTGYFEATEVSIMISLLKIIDNPHQDIPLASVLRSPIVNCTEEQLGNIRTAASSGSYWDALQSFVDRGGKQEDKGLQEKLEWFLKQLTKWRTMARSGAMAELIWQLYRDTQFYDFVGGTPGGKQRQANLRALYDRARQYEATSFRGLFRFLRFVERMRDRGDDLGAARGLSEQEDVVRLMTIHSSKGLEFPVVFLSGMARAFNELDLRGRFFLDKEFGLALPYVQPEKRISYETLPQLAFKEKKRLENLAEEMRVLYVAMTRAKERLYLVATLKDAQKAMEKWQSAGNHTKWLLPEFTRKAAKSYLDWIGPALIRHKDGAVLQQEQPLNKLEDPAEWSVQLIDSAEIEKMEEENVTQEKFLDLVQRHQPVPVESSSREEVFNRLNWSYPFEETTKRRSKQSVSDIKRMNEIQDERSAFDFAGKSSKKLFDRPKFLQETKISAAERGTIMHMVMQHIPLNQEPTVETIRVLLEEMERKELLTPEQKSAVSLQPIISFFDSTIGKRLLHAKSIKREIPFTYVAGAKELGLPSAQSDSQDNVLIQGVVDCLFEDEDGIVLLDYKTDRITDRFEGGFPQAKNVMKRRYTTQLSLYKLALEKILGRTIDETILYFFDGGHVLPLEGEEMDYQSKTASSIEGYNF
ncbi:helicase-exonuclease AddAB subunit AddA [Jeotgalibacillus proteolyticus]|uniref:ATP-dependent helicase/nuclease subunit A n=1 Tax=Jeotgalibacillus proteolyticus TaxID=2082395 RepID=A0A2S5GHH5_9BACL|nr:helicase-exonuclease AddAB subunit AddA [Jeotgalibacillus proteolyticus]PPA72374.1 helicase-exonuclease AddAB subunit AddA [Jeotgalibacillus proteolyticus]